MSELVEAAKRLLAMIERETKEKLPNDSDKALYVYIRDIEGARTRLTLAIDSLEIAGRLDNIIKLIHSAQSTDSLPSITINPTAYGAVLEAIDCWKENQEDGHIQK